jgi:hypothetical protein
MAAPVATAYSGIRICTVESVLIINRKPGILETATAAIIRKMNLRYLIQIMENVEQFIRYGLFGYDNLRCA